MKKENKKEFALAPNSNREREKKTVV